MFWNNFFSRLQENDNTVSFWVSHPLFVSFATSFSSSYPLILGRFLFQSLFFFNMNSSGGLICSLAQLPAADGKTYFSGCTFVNQLTLRHTHFGVSCSSASLNSVCLGKKLTSPSKFLCFLWGHWFDIFPSTWFLMPVLDNMVVILNISLFLTSLYPLNTC